MKPREPEHLQRSPGKPAARVPTGRDAAAAVARLQRGAGNRAVTQLVQRKVKEKPFYQEVLDHIAAEKRSQVVPTHKDPITGQRWRGRPIGGWDLPYWHTVESLARAVDAKDAAKTKEGIKALLASDPPGGASNLFSERLANELVARVRVMGLDGEAVELKRWLRKHTDMVGQSPRSFGPERRLWELTAERALAETKHRTKQEALTSIKLLARIFRSVFQEAASLDLAALEHERESRSTTYDPYEFPRPSDESISAYQTGLTDLLKKLFEAIQRCYQSILDSALGDLEKRRGGADPLKEARAVLESVIKPVVLERIEKTAPPDKDAKKPPEKITLSPEFLSAAITRSEYSKGGGRYLDFFLEGAAARKRSVAFDYYDRDQTSGSEKEMTLGRALGVRVEQLKFLEKLYRGDGNAALIARQGKMALHSDDDWRKFILAKFEDVRARTKDDEEALTQVVDLLKGYLAVFTIHTPFNIQDFGDNYLTKTFPRALTGQLVHDCGVYALRIAYALSLVREKLGLRFRFIRLPVHVGLVITPDTRGGKPAGKLPMFIVHNQAIEKVTRAEFDDWQKRSRGRGKKGEKLATLRPEDEPAFSGELAAGYFLPYLDTPYRLDDAPSFKNKAEYWSFFQKRIRPEVLAPQGGDLDQFHLRYLGAMESYKRIYNEKVRQYWNVDARNCWIKHKPGLLAALERVRKEKSEKAREAYRKACQEYRAELMRVRKPLDDAMKTWHREADDTSATLEQHPELIAKGAKRGYAKRTPVTFGWEQALEQHLAELANTKNLADPAKPDKLAPPYEDEKDLLPPMD